MIFAHQESAHFGCASARPLRPFSDRHSTFHHSLCLVLFRQLQVLPSHHFFADRFVCGFSSATCSITYHAWPEASQRWLDRTVQIVQAVSLGRSTISLPPPAARACRADRSRSFRSAP